MIKTLTFWCPYLGDVGTVKAVIESARSLSQSKKYKCKILNSYGEFDNYKSFLKNTSISKIKEKFNRYLDKFYRNKKYMTITKKVGAIIAEK